MKFKLVNESLIEGKRISFIPVFQGKNGDLVDEHGVSIGAKLSSGADLRQEMDPFQNGKANGAQIDPNHYIPKSEWDGICDDEEPEEGKEKELTGNEKPGTAKAKGKKGEPTDKQGKGSGTGEGDGEGEEVWQTVPERHVDDETGEEWVYQVCVKPTTSPNYGKGRWVPFDEIL